jgi:hypothetical protein
VIDPAVNVALLVSRDRALEPRTRLQAPAVRAHANHKPASGGHCLSSADEFATALSQTPARSQDLGRTGFGTPRSQPG